MIKRYSESRKRGCPTCDGIDARSCLRCKAHTMLRDWFVTERGIMLFCDLTPDEREQVLAQERKRKVRT